MPNTSPLFVKDPQIGMAQISTANTNRDGTGTLGDVVTGAANGTRVSLIRIVATGTTTAGMIRLFIYDGTNTRLWWEEAVSAITPSGSVKAFEAEIEPTQPLVLPENYVLKVGTHNAETFNVFAHGGDF